MRTRGPIVDAARALRKEPTRSERQLWNALRDRRLDGLKFRRQYPVGRFVVDFYCPAERLAVEVDGTIHERTREADAERQQLLESLGLTFIRLDAALLEQDLPGALALITETLARRAGEGRTAGPG